MFADQQLRHQICPLQYSADKHEHGGLAEHEVSFTSSINWTRFYNQILLGLCHPHPHTSSSRRKQRITATIWSEFEQQHCGQPGQLPEVCQSQQQQWAPGMISSTEWWAWTHQSWRTPWWTPWWWQWGQCWPCPEPIWQWPYRKLLLLTPYHSHSVGRRKRNKWEEKLVQIKRCKNKYRLSVLIVRSSWSMKINSIYRKGNQILYKNVQKNYNTTGEIFIFT